MLLGRGAGEHKYCIIQIEAFCFTRELDVLDVSSLKRRVSWVMSQMCIARGSISACTTRDLVTVLGSRWPGADTVGGV